MSAVEAARGLPPPAWPRVPGAGALARAGALADRVPGLVWVVAMTFVLRVVYGGGYVGYDALFALIWGHQIAGIHMPNLDATHAPAPHPLSYGLSTPLSRLGDDALGGLEILSLLAFAALAWGVYRLGSRAFSRPVGVLAALILLTRPLLVKQTLLSGVDISFLALVTWAAALEARRPKRGVSVLLVLALASFLRPESWLFAGVYALYVGWGRRPLERFGYLLLAGAPPVLWATADYIASHDAFLSLHGTQNVAERYNNPHSFLDALGSAPGFFSDVLSAPVAIAGVVGVALALARLGPRARLPAALLGLGMVSFVALGIAGLPLLPRYFFVPSTLLAVFCGVTVFGWTFEPRGSVARRAWAALAAAVVVALPITYLSRDRDELAQVKNESARLRTSQADLQRMGHYIPTLHLPKPTGGAPRHGTGFFRCGRIRLDSQLDWALLAYTLHAVNPKKILFGRATIQVADDGYLLVRPPHLRRYALPLGFERVRRNSSWVLWRYAACPGPAPIT
jgi:dolichyl-phosphate-mannose-protein mannosyltransferase